MSQDNQLLTYQNKVRVALEMIAQVADALPKHQQGIIMQNLSSINSMFDEIVNSGRAAIYELIEQRDELISELAQRGTLSTERNRIIRHLAIKFDCDFDAAGMLLDYLTDESSVYVFSQTELAVSDVIEVLLDELAEEAAAHDCYE